MNDVFGGSADAVKVKGRYCAIRDGVLQCDTDAGDPGACREAPQRPSIVRRMDLQTESATMDLET